VFRLYGVRRGRDPVPTPPLHAVSPQTRAAGPRELFRDTQRM
jgi:hypothetical protein